MIKRFCDKCGKSIQDRNFRVLSMTDADDNIILAMGEPILATADRIELCLECAIEVLKIIKENNNV